MNIKKYSRCWPVLSVVTSISFYACSGQVPKTVLADTLVLASTNQSAVVDSLHASVQIKLLSNKEYTPGKASQFKLLIYKPRLLKYPDGVYEVYLFPAIDSAAVLQPSHLSFVNVLNFYDPIAIGDSLWLDIDKQIGNISKSKKNLDSMIVRIVFKGNDIPTKGLSKQSGELHIQNIQIVQTKK